MRPAVTQEVVCTTRQTPCTCYLLTPAWRHQMTTAHMIVARPTGNPALIPTRRACGNNAPTYCTVPLGATPLLAGRRMINSRGTPTVRPQGGARRATTCMATFERCALGVGCRAPCRVPAKVCQRRLLAAPVAGNTPWRATPLPQRASCGPTSEGPAKPPCYATPLHSFLCAYFH